MTGPSSGKSESRKGNPAHLSIDFFFFFQKSRQAGEVEVKAPAASEVLEVRKKKTIFFSP